MDLLSRAAACFNKPEEVRSILDLGCGPGNVTEALCSTFPNATVEGIDSSVEMIQQAQSVQKNSQHSDRISFRVSRVELEAQSNPKKYDLVYSNATLHWVSSHDTLLPQLLKQCVEPNGGVLAVQMPDTRRQPSHVAMEKAAFHSGMYDKICMVSSQIYFRCSSYNYCLQ